MEYIILFLFGSTIGSFLNVLIYRLEESEKREVSPPIRQLAGGEKKKILRSIFFGRSYCPQCKHQIRWYDNIPILSFLILAGKCRDCGQRISIQYPLVELATGILFAIILNFKFLIFKEFLISNFQIADWIVLVYLLVIFSGLFAVFVYDLKHYIIPNKIIYPLILFVMAFGVLGFLDWDLFRNLKLEIRNFQSWQNILLSLTVPLFFLSLIIVSRGRWMGLGDVKLALFMALFLGWPNVLVAAILSFWIGTLASLPLIFIGKKGLKSQIPFGPFLILGTFLAYFWGSEIISWYLSISN